MYLLARFCVLLNLLILRRCIFSPFRVFAFMALACILSGECRVEDAILNPDVPGGAVLRQRFSKRHSFKVGAAAVMDRCFRFLYIFFLVSPISEDVSSPDFPAPGHFNRLGGRVLDIPIPFSRLSGLLLLAPILVFFISFSLLATIEQGVCLIHVTFACFCNRCCDTCSLPHLLSFSFSRTG